MASALKQQRSWFDDGFFNTFLIAAPIAPQIYASEMRQCEAPVLSITCILYFVKVKKMFQMLKQKNFLNFMKHYLYLKVLHSKKNNFTFDRKAELLIDNEHNLQIQRITSLESRDNYFGYIFYYILFN